MLRFAQHDSQFFHTFEGVSYDGAAEPRRTFMRPGHLEKLQ